MQKMRNAKYYAASSINKNTSLRAVFTPDNDNLWQIEASNALDPTDVQLD